MNNLTTRQSSKKILHLVTANLIESFRAHYSPNEHGQCWEWQGALRDKGYGKLYIRRKAYSAHRVAWVIANNAEIPEGMCVCHSCDNPACVNPDHLWIGTDADNLNDKVSKGRQARGIRVSGAKLNDSDVETIFVLREAGWLHRQIAARFGVGTKHVADILARRNWAHVRP